MESDLQPIKLYRNRTIILTRRSEGDFMKYLLCVILIQSLASAKVTDFNSIINEDLKEQKELHRQFKKQVNAPALTEKENLVSAESRQEIKAKELIVVENAQKSYAAPSNENFLKFNKEIGEAKTQNQRKNQHRVAKELKELEQ